MKGADLAIKDRIEFLTTAEEVDEFLRRHPDSIIFKAGTCHKTYEALALAQSALEPREDLSVGIIRVIEAQAASQRVAALTDVPHESPQIFLFKNGTAIFNRDNWDITADAIATALEAGLADRQEGAGL